MSRTRIVIAFIVASLAMFVVLGVVSLAGEATATPTPTAAGGLGDVNDDGVINCCDITQCELCILYPEAYPKENYPGWDANEDNTGPNAGDILAVEYRILGTWPLLPTPTPTPSLMPGDVTVSRNTAIGSVIRAIQDSNFFAEGRHWVFYVDDYHDYYKSSTDGIIWSNATQVGNSWRGYDMSVWYDGQFVHYVRSLYVDAGELYYRRGLPQSNGSIAWSDEQLVYDATTHMFAGAPVVATDSDGYPYIAFILVDKTAYPQERTSVVYLKSSTKNGTWTTEWEEELASHPDGNELFPDIIPLNSGEMYAIYCRHEGGNPWSTGPCNQIKGRLWNGSAWGAEEVCTISNVENDQFTEWEAVAIGNDVHLVFLQESTYNITYVKRTYGFGWGSEVTVQPATARNVIPALSRDGSDLYCFWLGQDDYVYYKECHNGSWDSSPAQCFDETFRGFCPWPETNIQAAYESQNNEIGVLWEADTGDTSAVFIRLGIFPIEQSPTPTPTASPMSDGQSFTVTLTESNISVRTPTQNSNFYALGRHWVFYAANSSTICYRTSADGGETWSDSYIVPTEATDLWAMGAIFDVLADADNRLHIASAVWNGNLSYISGLLGADGTVSWAEVNGSAVQLVWQHPGQQLQDATIAIDTDGYPWISVTRFNGIKTVNVFKSSTKNGIWTEERADELYSGGVRLSKIMALPDGEMYCLWTSYNLSVVGRLWNGSGWEAEEVGTDYGTAHYFSPHSEIVVGADIHIVYTRNVTYELAYVVRDYDSGWGEEQVLYDGVDYKLAPALSRGGEEYLCVFWLDDTGGNKVLYKLLEDGEWSETATLTTEAVQFTGVAHIQSADDLHISGNEFEGILYSVGDYYGPPPYTIKFAKFTLATPIPTPTLTASPTPTVTSTTPGQGFTVTETSSYRSVRTPAQRSNFYANGRHWVFYETDDDIYYRSSTTGQNWSSPTLVEVEECPFKYGAMFSVWEFNGYVHFVFAPLKGGTPAGNISYRRGELNSSGSINWDATQIVYACPSDHRLGDPVITVGADGYPYIAAGIYYHDGTTSNVTVFKSSTANGTWIEDWTANISSGAGILLPSLTPLENGDVLCTYYSATIEGDTVKARLWNGSGWEAAEVCTDEGIPQYSFSSYSVVAINSTVHLVYLGNVSYNLSYVCRDPIGGWGSEELIYHNSSSWQTAPALSRLGNDVYCFWLDDSGGGWVFYKVLSNGSWGDTEDWILESAPFTLNYTIQSSYDLTDELGGVLYQVNTSSPYQIKFGRDAF